MADFHINKDNTTIYSAFPITETTAKLNIQKELILMETCIYYFYNIFYIPEIKNLEFHLPHVIMFGNHTCDKEHHQS